MSDGTALSSGLTPGLVLILVLSLFLQAKLLQFFSGVAAIHRETRVGCQRCFPVIFFLTSALNLALLLYALQHWGAAEIREKFEPKFWLTFIGQAWTACFIANFQWLGISLRDDAMERHNLAAFLALLGASLAVGLIYTAGNIGEGPSYMDNFLSAGIATIAFFVLWLALELTTRISSAITEDRDLATGIRSGAFFLAQGLILARAIAGDWHSTEATVRDFLHDGVFSIVLLSISIPIEFLFRPNSKRPNPNWIQAGLLFALLYFVAAVFWLIHLGPWEGCAR